MNRELALLRIQVARHLSALDAYVAGNTTQNCAAVVASAGFLRTMIARTPKPPEWGVHDDTSEELDMEGHTLIRRRLPGGDFCWRIETPDGALLGTLRPEDPPQSVLDGADAAREEYRRACGERTEPEDRTGAER